jgi:serine protease AprX
MKRIKLKMSLVALLVASVVSAQTPEQRQEIIKNYNLEALQQLSEKFDAENKENYALALKLAEEKGWALEITDNGQTGYLVGVHDNGDPIYRTTYNSGAAVTSRVNRINTGGALGLNLNGQNMFVGVWDQNIPMIGHNDFGGRVQILDGATTQTSLHSTHVVGTVAGSGAGNASARGMAHQSNVYALDWNNDYSEMTLVASYGVLVSNHSYGQIAGQLQEFQFGAYTARSRDMDLIAANAPYFLSVHAAGNDRNAQTPVNPSKNGYDLINGNKTSKNSVVVAAVNQVNNYTGPSSVSMSSFSSWGPTDDFRIKPDISAKGVGVTSTSNASITAYATQQGTSMAAPVVAGGLILIQEHYSNLNLSAFMRASTLRALMIHAADEAGPHDGPDPMFGWGLFNAEKAVDIISKKPIFISVIDELTLNQGQTYSRPIYATGSEPLVATIAWTDVPGNVSNGVVDAQTPVLVNDLDLRITSLNGTTTYLPWRLGSTYTSAAVKADNSVDNVEKIEIPNVPPGHYILTVTHKGNIQRLNPSAPQSQEFGLIITGIDETLSNDRIVDVPQLVVYPNPVSNQLFFKLDGLVSSTANVKLIDLQGRVVKELKDVKVQENNTFIDVASLSRGAYIIQFELQNNQVIHSKFIKN